MLLKSTKDNRGFFRDYNDFNPDLYIRDLRKSNLGISVNATKGANEQYNEFHNDLLSNINKIVPLKALCSKKIDIDFIS